MTGKETTDNETLRKLNSNIEESNKIMTFLTWVMVILTFVLVVLTVKLAFPSFFNYFIDFLLTRVIH